MIKEVKSVQFDKEGKKNLFSKIIVDCELIIKIDNKVVGRLVCLPEKFDLLGWGFLVTGGWIESKEDVEEFSIKKNFLKVKLKEKVKSRMASILAGCGKEVFFVKNGKGNEEEKKILTEQKFKFSIIANIMREFQVSDSLHQQTGGTHSAGVGCGEKLLFSIPDIGRNNAVQKVIGKIFLEKIPTYDKLLFTTGRISREMVVAVSQVSIPVIVSKSAPLLSTIELANEKNITILGFVRGQRMTCFSGFDRISEN